jgi:DNA-binding NtrC family response regulator
MNVNLAHHAEPEAVSGPDKKRILIVDDDSSVRDSIAAVLRDAGYDVLQAGHAQEALSQHDAKKIDLLLLDLGLPDKSGWDAFEAFTHRNPLLPVIIITGHASQSGMAMAAGVGALMEKPLDAGKLLQTMQDLLNETEETRLRRLCGYRKDVRYIPTRPGAHLIGGAHAFQHY